MMLEDIMATEPDPRPGPALRGEPLSDQLLARLSGEAALWVDGGSIARWAPVYGRAAKPVAPTGQHGRFVFTRIAAPPVEGTIRRWVEHQRMLVRAEDGVSPQLVFWRLAARQRAFAIDAYPCVDVKTASDRVRGLAHRAAYLQVTLGFFAGETLGGLRRGDARDGGHAALPPGADRRPGREPRCAGRDGEDQAAGARGDDLAVMARP
jgi:hypothetical protein